MVAALRTDLLGTPLGERRGTRERYQPGPSLEGVAAGASLGRGHSGDGVRLVQLAMNLAGATPPLAEDGLFGPKTEAALKGLQGRLGASDAPGVLGASSLGALLGLVQASGGARGGVDGFSASTGRGGPRAPSSTRLGGTTLRAPSMEGAVPLDSMKAGTLAQLHELGRASERRGGEGATGLVASAYSDYREKLGGGSETRLREGADRELGRVMGRLDDPVRVGGRTTTRRALVDEIAQKADVPPELVAGIWYREDDEMRTDRYLHNGEKLGRTTQLVPKGIFFGEDQFVDAAVHALGQKRATADALGLHYGSKDPAAMAAFAERYNGMGYRSKGRPSAYVTGGTEHYRGGMYVADHVYDPNAFDQRLGVLPILLAYPRA